MKWILQTNIYEEEGYGRILSAIERRGLPLTTVKVVPFVGDLEPVSGELPGPYERAIVMGSYSLARVATQRGWYPGAFLENLDYTIQRNHWGERMLNHDAEIFRFVDVPFQREPFFLRPVHDTKAFSGLVLDWGDYTKWRDGLLRIPELADPVNDPLGVNLLTADTPVMVCTEREIYTETRTWVIPDNGYASPVVTSSGYKVGSFKRYSEMVDPWIHDYVDECCSVWTPNGAFVMDIADTPEGPRIIEINNLNSAGWYKADVGKLVDALERKFG